jgi:hypothetical protein
MTIPDHVGSITIGSTATMLWREALNGRSHRGPVMAETISRFHCADPWSSRWPDAINP